MVSDPRNDVVRVFRTALPQSCRPILMNAKNRNDLNRLGIGKPQLYGRAVESVQNRLPVAGSFVSQTRPLTTDHQRLTTSDCNYNGRKSPTSTKTE